MGDQGNRSNAIHSGYLFDQGTSLLHTRLDYEVQSVRSHVSRLHGVVLYILSYRIHHRFFRIPIIVRTEAAKSLCLYILLFSRIALPSPAFF